MAPMPSVCSNVIVSLFHCRLAYTPSGMISNHCVLMLKRQSIFLCDFRYDIDSKSPDLAKHVSEKVITLCSCLIVACFLLCKSILYEWKLLFLKWELLFWNSSHSLFLFHANQNPCHSKAQIVHNSALLPIVSQCGLAVCPCAFSFV